jgi:hypothetical protein
MSQENVDKTTAFIEAYNRRDFDAAVEFFDPEVEWVLPAHQAFDSCRGFTSWPAALEASGLGQ